MSKWIESIENMELLPTGDTSMYYVYSYKSAVFLEISSRLPNQREVKLDDSDVIVREVENGSLANSRGNNDDEFTISDSQDHLFLSVSSQLTD